MKEIKIESQEGDSISFEKEISNLMQEQLLFTESIYVHLPMGVEVYDAVGLLHSINDYALKMYGVEDRNTVIGVVNLFNSPYVDEELKTKIQRGENIVLEFEYDFDRINRNAYFSSNNKNSMIYEVKVVPVRNKKEAIIGHILLTNDVTAKKEAEFHTEENKKNLEMAMDATNMSSWVYDVYKKTFSSLYGSPIVESISTLEDLLKIMHPQDQLQLLQLFGQLEQREIQQGQITARIYNEKEKQYRYYESRMRLSSEHFGKLLIIGTEMDVTEKVQLAKKTEELIAKRELAMQVSNIVHWDFDVRTRKFESYNDPVNDYASDKLLTIEEQMNVIHPEDRSSAYDAIQIMLSGKDLTVEFSCRIKTKHDKTWSYCNIIGVPFERDENGDIVRYTGFRQNISKQHQLDEELRERNYKMELTFKTVGMSYWDFDVESGQFRAFNDPVNDFHSEKPIFPEDYLNTAHPDDVNCVREYINRILLGVNSDFNLKYRSKKLNGMMNGKPC